MTEIVRIETDKIEAIINKPFDLETLLKKMTAINYSFYDTEHRVGDFIIKVFRKNNAFTGGSILFNEETKEFIFLTEEKTKKKCEYIIISNNSRSENDLKKLINEFTGIIPIEENSFLNSVVFRSVLKHRVRPFEKERRLNIGSKSFTLLTLYSFSKLGSSSYDSLPKSYVTFLKNKSFKRLSHLSEAAKNNLDLKNSYLNGDYNFVLHLMIHYSMSSKKFRHLYKIYGTKQLLLMKDLYIAYVNEVFNV